MTSLRNLRILNTRPAGQNQALTQSLTQAGAHVIELPMIKITPLSHAWIHSLPCSTEINALIFISANAVHYFFNAIREHSGWNKHLPPMIAIGSATHNAICNYHSITSSTPIIADSEHLLLNESLLHVNKKKIMIIKGVGGRPLLEDTLRARGAEVITLSVYERTLPDIPQEITQALWQNNEVDIILFTSYQSMQHAILLFGEAAHSWLCATPCIVISERLANLAIAIGIKTVLTCRYDTLINELEMYASTRTDYDGHCAQK